MLLEQFNVSGMLVPKAEALSGTYLLEERSSNFYNMVSAGSPQSISSSKKRLVRRADRLQHTELPPLSNLDELLVRSCAPDMKKPVEEAPLRLPPIDDSAQVSIGTFKKLLAKPGSSHVSPSWQENDEPLQWHILLLKASFDGKLEVSTVAEWLVEVLSMDVPEATRCAEAAKVHPTVRVASLDDWKMVKEKVESLRALGLAVQVASGAIHQALVNGQRGDSRGRLAKESYTEIFDLVPGLKRSRPAKKGKGTESHPHRAKWRGMSQLVVMDVLSKDPVKNILTEEDDEDESSWLGTESEAEWTQWNLLNARKKRVKRILNKRGRKLVKMGSLPAPSESDKTEKLTDKTTCSFRSSVIETQKKMSMIAQLQGTPTLTFQRKEACQMLRFFVFGAVGNEHLRAQADKDSIFYDRLGERWQVQQLYNLWDRLDCDHSGRCDFSELRRFAEVRLKALVEAALAKGTKGLAGLPAWAAAQSGEDVAKAANKLMKTLEQMLFGMKTSFVLEDMIRILWPMSQPNDVLEMRRWCTEMANSIERTGVQTPPLLPEEKVEDLRSIFKYFDTDNDGQLQVPDLLATGFLNPREVDLIIEKYDADEDGRLGVLEFVEMLCPAGYRAHEKVTHATLRNGKDVVYDTEFCRWRLVNHTLR